MKSEVYSWRLSPEVKADLERAARLRNMSVSSVLEIAVRDWLNKSVNSDDEAVEARIRSAAESCFGTIAGRNPRRSQMTRELVRKRLKQRHGS